MKKRFLAILPAVAAVSALSLTSCGGISEATAEKEEIQYNESDKITSETAYELTLSTLKTKEEALIKANYTAANVTEANPYAQYTAKDFTISQTSIYTTTYGDYQKTNTTVTSQEYDDDNKALHAVSSSTIVVESASIGNSTITNKEETNLQYDGYTWFELDLINKTYDTDKGIDSYEYNEETGDYEYIIQDYAGYAIDNWSLDSYSFDDSYDATNFYYFNSSTNTFTIVINQTNAEAGYSYKVTAQYSITDSGIKYVYDYTVTHLKYNDTETSYSNSEITFTDATVETYDFHDFSTESYY